jgi:hypothetical protein
MWAIVVTLLLFIFGLLAILGSAGYLGARVSDSRGILVIVAIVAWLGASIAGYRVYDAFSNEFITKKA